MKNILVFLSVIVLSSCSSTQSIQEVKDIQQEVKIQSNTGVTNYVNGIIKIHFDEVDKNKDSFLSINEYPDNKQFDEIDTDKDKKISGEEYQKYCDGHYISKEGIRTSIVTSLKYFNVTDNVFTKTNTGTYTGFMTKEQFLKYAKSSFLTKEEFSIFYVADKNNDGKLSFTEFEDCVYAISKGNLEASHNIVPAPPQISPEPIPSTSK